MNIRPRRCAASLLALAILACLSTPVRAQEEETPLIGYFDAITAEAPPVVGETYYTRHTFWQNKDEHVTTNYRYGTIVPINTEVTLVSLKGKGMQLRVAATGQVITVTNAEKYTLKDMPAIARNLLTRAPVPIERFGDTTAENIRSGTVTFGMTKEQVIMTRGYPPAHGRGTASLDLDKWTYWEGRAATTRVEFTNGKVVNIVD